ncbi:MAG: alpha/beta fold hydrolase, partial [Coxiellaceae bacterium]|nr:alpha/beta fold hydrolase [Coxiellaceae bacterium]
MKSLVLLHGWGFNAKVWGQFIPYLENNFTITALNLFHTEPLNLETITQHVLKNTPEKAFYLGWSLGGLIAMNIAIHHPEKISKLVTIASTPKFIASDNWPGMSNALLEKFYESLKTDYKKTLQQFIALQFYGSQTDRTVIQTLKKQLSNNEPPSVTMLSDTLDILKKTDLRNELKKITCPQFYLFGRYDTLVPEGITQ